MLEYDFQGHQKYSILEKREKLSLIMLYLTEIMLTCKPKIAYHNFSFSFDSCLIFTSTEVFEAIIITRVSYWKAIICSLDNSFWASSLYSRTLIGTITVALAKNFTE